MEVIPLQRKLTQLLHKSDQQIIGEWRGDKADLTMRDAYEEFSPRFTAKTHMKMPYETFEEQFELIRFQEILPN